MSDDATDQTSPNHSEPASADPKTAAQDARRNAEKLAETILGGNAGVHLPSESKPSEPKQGGRPKNVPADFGSFVVSLGTNCMIHLGHIPHPETQKTARDLSSAKHTIDLLQMLRKKTEGNLVDEEKKLVDTLIHDLKSAYVQETKAKN